MYASGYMFGEVGGAADGVGGIGVPVVRRARWLLFVQGGGRGASLMVSLPNHGTPVRRERPALTAGRALLTENVRAGQALQWRASRRSSCR